MSESQGEPGPYERHERVDQELLREAQAAKVDGGDEDSVVVPGTNADTIRSARNKFAREAQARAEAHDVDQRAGTSGVTIMSPEEYLERTPERNAYRAELHSAGLVDARRTVEKAEAVLRHVAVYFDRKDSMNAAQHLSDQVIQSPLHGEVLSVLAAIDLFKQGYPAEGS